MQINLIYLRFNLKKIKILSLLSLFIGTSILAISQKIELINPTFLGNENLLDTKKVQTSDVHKIKKEKVQAIA